MEGNMSLQTLEDLFVHELHDLHSAENQLVSALPRMANAAASYRLRRSFQGQVEQARDRAQRLQQILQQLATSVPDATYDYLEGTVGVLVYGEWVPVESSKSPPRSKCVPADSEATPFVPGATFHAVEGAIEQTRKLIDEDAQPHVKDAGLIAEAQRIEHYEMAGYGAARAHARLLGHADAERFLRQMLNEAEQTNEKLTELSECEINTEVLQPS
jgi:ferritin-like metal-binding protein YciE